MFPLGVAHLRVIAYGAQTNLHWWTPWLSQFCTNEHNVGRNSPLSPFRAMCDFYTRFFWTREFLFRIYMHLNNYTNNPDIFRVPDLGGFITKCQCTRVQSTEKRRWTIEEEEKGLVLNWVRKSMHMLISPLADPLSAQLLCYLLSQSQLIYLLRSLRAVFIVSFVPPRAGSRWGQELNGSLIK